MILLCKCMKVSRSGYYYFKDKPISKRSRQNDELLLHIIEAFKESKKTYGSPRIYRVLRKKGINTSLNRVARIMKKYGIYPEYSLKHKKSKLSKNYEGTTNNILNREFKANEPNQKWVSDTTFISTKQGWLYLATIIDLYSRKVIGWSMSSSNNTGLVLKALEMALLHKKRAKPILLHSDQGVQYRAKEYLNLFKKNNIQQSMSRKGECHDNAVAESFFNTLKKESIQSKTYQTRDEARLAIFEYIELFYNSTRLHSTIDYQSPNDFEKSFYKKIA